MTKHEKTLRAQKVLEDYRKGERVCSIASRYGISPTTVCMIAKRAGVNRPKGLNMRGWRENPAAAAVARASLQRKFGWGEIKSYAVEAGIGIRQFYSMRSSERAAIRRAQKENAA